MGFCHFAMFFAGSLHLPTYLTKLLSKNTRKPATIPENARKLVKFRSPNRAIHAFFQSRFGLMCLAAGEETFVETSRRGPSPAWYICAKVCLCRADPSTRNLDMEPGVEEPQHFASKNDDVWLSWLLELNHKSWQLLGFQWSDSRGLPNSSFSQRCGKSFYKVFLSICDFPPSVNDFKWHCQLMDCKQSNFSASKEEYMNKQKPVVVPQNLIRSSHLHGSGRTASHEACQIREASLG